jgi:hypothetical protein
VIAKNSVITINDSCLSNIDSANYFVSNPLFSDNLLSPIHQTPIINNHTSAVWQTVILFSVFSIFVLIKITEPKKFLKLFAYIFSTQSPVQLFREEFKLNKKISVLLSVCLMLTIGFLLHITNNYFGLILNDSSSIQQYLFFIGVLFIGYLLKLLINSLFAHISLSSELQFVRL